MEYNILNYGLVYPNYSDGDVILTRANIDALMNNTASITVGPSSVLCIECDFGERVAASVVRYYTSESTNTSDISIQFKNLPSDTYTDLVVVPQTTSFRSDLFNHKPRYLKITHSPSTSTTVSGLYVLNDTSYTGFGDSGDLLSFDIETSLDTTTIVPIRVHNHGEAAADAFVSIEPSGTSLDDVLFISAYSNGPWMNSNTNSVPVIGAEVYGQTYTNAGVSNGSIVLTSKTTSGTVVSPIFRNNEHFTGLNVNCVEVDDTKISSDTTKMTNTAEIRYTTTRPLSKSLVRIMRNDNKYIDISGINASTLYTSAQITTYNNSYYSRCCVNPITGTTYIVSTSNYTYNDSYLYFSKVNVDRTYSQSYIDGTDNYATDITVDVKFMLPDIYDGVWVYMYVDNHNKPIHATTNLSVGYHLMRFDSSRAIVLDITDSVDFIDSMSVSWDTNELWYTSSYYNWVAKMNSLGEILFNVTDRVSSLKGIAAYADGGCVYIDNGSLVFVSADGDVTNIVDDVTSSETIYIDPIDNNLLWFMEGYNVVRYVVDDDRVNREFYVPSLEEIFVGHSKIMCLCTDRKVRVYDKYSDSYVMTDRLSNAYYPALFDLDYDRAGSLSYMFPVAEDTSLSSLPWKSIDYQNYKIPKDVYYQLRFTLLPDTTLTKSPELIEVSTQSQVDLGTIQSSAYRNVYVKVDGSDDNVGGNYTSSLIVRWRVYV